MFNDKYSVEIDGDCYRLDYTSFQLLCKFQKEGYNYIEQNLVKGSSWPEKAS